jgi:hypothetical protein
VARGTTSKAVAATAMKIDRKALTENTLLIEDIHIMGKHITRPHPKIDGEDSIGGR